jgi:integrase
VAKRGNGEGSIYRDAEGRWTAAVSLGYRNGKRRRKVIRSATRTVVAERLKKIHRDEQMGLPIAPERQTTGEFLKTWIEAVKPAVRPKTYRSYEQMIRNHLVPGVFPKPQPSKYSSKNPKEFRDFGLAKIQLSKLSIEKLDLFFVEKIESGCSPALVRYLRVVLRIALNEALRRGLVARNVAELTKPPRVAKPEIIPLDFEQAKHFLAAIDSHRFETLFMVGLSVGLRHGEALALQVDDYDHNTGTLKVFHTLQRIDGNLQRVETKSPKGKRIVPLPDSCIAAVEKHLKRREEMRHWAGSRWKDTGYLFCSNIGTALLERNVLRDLYKVLQVAGLGRRSMHDLRHSCVTLLGAQGVPLRTIADIVGHSDIRLTQNVYQHAFMSMKRDAVNALDVFLKTPGVATPVATPGIRKKAN